VIGGAVLTLPLWMILRHGGSSPVMDASTTAYSIVGQFLLNFKITENWIIWFVVDVIYVVIYIQQSLYVTAGLYAVFVVLCIKGYIDWRKTAIAALEATA
jgi:nicotinamide mononucleotide transporter